MALCKEIGVFIGVLLSDNHCMEQKPIVDANSPLEDWDGMFDAVEDCSQVQRSPALNGNVLIQVSAERANKLRAWADAEGLD